MFPVETPGVIEPFSCWKSDIKEFSACGIGTFLYFYFIKFIIFCLLIILLMSAVPFVVISQGYSNSLLTFCAKNKDVKTCAIYQSSETTNLADWLYQMSYENGYYYEQVTKEMSADFQKTVASYPRWTVDYNLVNFLTMIALLLVNIFFIILLRMLVKEADFGQITPSDFTLMIDGITNFYAGVEDLKDKVMIV